MHNVKQNKRTDWNKLEEQQRGQTGGWYKKTRCRVGESQTCGFEEDLLKGEGMTMAVSRNAHRYAAEEGGG